MSGESCDSDVVRNVRSVARSYFEADTSPAHDWYHVRRVAANAERLLAATPDADPRTVRLAVLLHDVGRPKEARGEIDDHAAWGAAESRKVLGKQGVPEATRDAVAHCVRAHRYSNDVAPETPEAKVVSDADDLDALGAVGLGRCFAHGGEHGKPLHGPSLLDGAAATSDEGTQFEHIHEKLLDLPKRMFTDAGRERAEERAAFVREFAQRFEGEVNGDA